ncbi:MAG: energy-coupling factor transporter ATPase [Firmicutes bacterium]|nr:energy-coupling factor transporter ATPase [Bacillota bacterium]
MAEPLIACQEVHYTYLRGTPMEAPALRGVSLQIARGECVAILGPTGSGKSTLIQHFNGLLRPTAGRVLVAGQDLWAPRADRRAARRLVGLVFQFPEYQLFAETVEQDVAFGPRNLGWAPEAVAEAVDEALRLVGLAPERFAGRSPFALSGGEMRRVALAGVLAMRPAVLVLDEPTAGLDGQGRHEIRRILRDVHRRGQTVVLVTHHMDDVAELAQRVVVLRDGTVALAGAVGEVFAREDALRQLGLDLPVAARVTRRLRALGVPVADALTLQDARRAIRTALRGTGRGDP